MRNTALGWLGIVLTGVVSFGVTGLFAVGVVDEITGHERGPVLRPAALEPGSCVGIFGHKVSCDSEGAYLKVFGPANHDGECVGLEPISRSLARSLADAGLRKRARQQRVCLGEGPALRRLN